MAFRQKIGVAALFGAWFLLSVVVGLGSSPEFRPTSPGDRPICGGAPSSRDFVAELPGGTHRPIVHGNSSRRNFRSVPRSGSNEATGVTPPPVPAVNFGCAISALLPSRSAARLPAAWFRPNPVRAGPAF